MQISIFLFSLLLFSASSPLSAARDFEPSPAPAAHFDGISALVPASGGNGLPPLSPEPAEAPLLDLVAAAGEGGEENVAPAPEEDGDLSFGEISPSFSDPEDAGTDTVRWCAVKEKFEDCQLLVSLINQSNDSTWKCVQKDTIQECLESIKEAESDITTLEAGHAYTAFINYSMKAIANEIYCDRAHTYSAVAVVNKKFCLHKNHITLSDLKGQKSCHGGHSTAAGWNFPITYITEELYNNSTKGVNNYSEIAGNIFSKICAPSEFDGVGVCSGCGMKNGSCDSSGLFLGDLGAFRCLVEGFGDVAFVRGDAPLLYSMEGRLNQSWSTKSVRDFMYLCPQGGCREINGYPRSCSFGDVPADVLMSSNYIPNKKRMMILKTLTNTTLMDALVMGRKSNGSHILSPSTEELAAVKKLTRSYLGESALISKGIQEINNPKNGSSHSTIPSISASGKSSSRHQNVLIIAFCSVLLAIGAQIQFN